MAEIHIEKKRKPVWPWILGLLLLVGLAWVIIEATNKDEKAVSSQEGYFPEEEYSAPESPDATGTQREGELGMTPADTTGVSKVKTQELITFVNETEFEEGMALDHEVTADGIQKLSEAIQEVSDNEHSETVNQLQQTAEEIRKDPQSLTHADKVQSVVADAAETLKQIQEEQFPELESQVNDLEKASQAVKADEELLNQSEDVKVFFEKAASTLNEMSGIESEMEPS